MAMDISRIQELLDCAVCFEPLKNNSKVLPCQHTFCKGCLKNVARTKGCLQCPECRSVFRGIDVESLPPNVLLERLMGELTLDKGKVNVDNNKCLPVLFKWQGLKDKQKQPSVKALFDFKGTEEGDLAFCKGDMIVLNDFIDENWYEGVLNGVRGVVPANFVQVTVPFPSIEEISLQEPSARALYDFQETDEDELLTFKKGDVFAVIKRINHDWGEGMTEDQHGIFPLNFVELNAAAEICITAWEATDEEGNDVESANADGEFKKTSRKRHTIHVDNPDQLQMEQCSREEEFSVNRSRRSSRRASETSLQESISEMTHNSRLLSSNSSTTIGCSPNSTMRHAFPCGTPCGARGRARKEMNKAPETRETALQRGQRNTVADKPIKSLFKGNRLRSWLPASDRHYKNTPTNYTRYLAHSTSARSSAPSHVHSSSAPALMTQLLDRNGGYCTSFNTPHPAQLRRQRTGSEPIDPNTLVRTEKKKKGLAVFRAFKRGSNDPAPVLPPYNSIANTSNMRICRPVPVLPSEPPPPYSPPLMKPRSTSFEGSSSSLLSGQWFKAIASFPTNQEAELDLEIGDMLLVTKKRDDGWYHGKSKRTGKKGLFPSSFVERIYTDNHQA